MPEQRNHGSEVPVRHEEVKDIIERMPSRFGLIASGFLMFIFFTILIFGWIIKYPDIVKGELKLNAVLAPVKIVCNVSGKLQLNKFPTKHVFSAGDYIGYIQNAAKFNDVILIDSLIQHLTLNKLNYNEHRYHFPKNLQLGELNESYFIFLNALYTSLDHYNLDLLGKQQEILSKQAVVQQQVVSEIENDLYISKNSYSLLENSYHRDSVLLSRKVLAPSELEKSKIILLSAKRGFGSLNTSLYNNKYQLEDVISKIQQLKIQREEREKEIELKLISAYYDLTEAIKQWQTKYVFIAPISGLVEYSDFWTNDEYIFAGREVFSIVPNRKDMYAQVLLPENGAGKVSKGQAVIIKLNDFPYNEYGSVRGVIDEISLIANQRVNSGNQKENMYLVKVKLPKGLITNYGTELNFKFGAKGIAEIITDDRRLFSRLFDNLKYSIKR